MRNSQFLDKPYISKDYATLADEYIEPINIFRGKKEREVTDGFEGKSDRKEFISGICR